MKNKAISDWRDYYLQSDEIEILESIERGVWKTIGNIEKRRQELRNFLSDETF